MVEIKYTTISLTIKEIDRIFSRISINPNTNCWNWTGAQDGAGYGVVGWRNQSVRIHRLIYSYLIYPIPAGRGKNIPVCDHLCNNRRCCNPDHIQIVTNKENILRGNGQSSINSKKIYCNNGHQLPEQRNTQGTRSCKICLKEYNKKYHKSHPRDRSEYYKKYDREQRDRK